jgi:hypothetical protein
MIASQFTLDHRLNELRQAGSRYVDSRGVGWTVPAATRPAGLGGSALRAIVGLFTGRPTTWSPPSSGTSSIPAPNRSA